MGASKENETGTNRTLVERVSDRELRVTRTFDAPVRIVFRAWTSAELFKQWWVPKSTGAALLSCQLDVRTGGSYRLEFGAAGASMAFFGRYLEVVENERIVWTNEESEQGAVTTVTFEQRGGKTLLVLHERYPSKEALDASAGAEDALPETFTQLDEFLASPAARA